MRIITWNCKGAFRRKHEMVSRLAPDIVIVPESEELLQIEPTLGSTPPQSFAWFGDDKNKGLAVLGYGNYSCQVHPDYDANIRWVVPLIVTGPISFTLFAVWTLPYPYTGSYVHPLFEAFERYQPLMSDPNVVWAGDFNANPVYDLSARKYKFRDFVSLMKQRDLESVYHTLKAINHGEEVDCTFHLRHDATKGSHLDYIFASKTLVAKNVSPGSHADWSKLSDHVPLSCDFADTKALTY